MSKSHNVRVTTMEAEMDFKIRESTGGYQLFDQVVSAIGLNEIRFFGLQYTDTFESSNWIKLDKKIMIQKVKKESPLKLYFRVKFYPEDVSDEITQEVTKRLFYFQIKNAVLSEEIYASPETSVLLASFALQVKYGDYSPDLHGKLIHDRVLPQRVLDQHKISPEEWQSRLVSWWDEHKGIKKEEAMMEYLKVAQDLEMYGVNYFEIKNRRGTHLWLGVDALGLNIYSRENRLTPKVGFPWTEIQKISFVMKKFVIRPLERRAPDFVFFAHSKRTNKKIFSIAVGNHELYKMRRMPEDPSAYRMKSRSTVREEKMALEEEVARLKVEVRKSHSTEEKQKEYEEKLRKMEEAMKLRENELEEAKDLIRRLEKQLKELREAKEKLERREKELEVMMRQLEMNIEMEVADRVQLSENIRLKQEEIERIQKEIEAKDQEVWRLHEEIESVRRNQLQIEAVIAKANEDQERIIAAHRHSMRKQSISMTSSSDEEKVNANKVVLRKNGKRDAGNGNRQLVKSEISTSELTTSSDDEETIRMRKMQYQFRKEANQSAVASAIARPGSSRTNSRTSRSSRSSSEDHSISQSQRTSRQNSMDHSTNQKVSKQNSIDHSANQIHPRPNSAEVSTSTSHRAPLPQRSISIPADPEEYWTNHNVDNNKFEYGKRRQTEAERNHLLRKQLQVLTQELAEKRVETLETPMDKIHYQNVGLGRTKYRSLREVRQGNTKRRVDFFENM